MKVFRYFYLIFFAGFILSFYVWQQTQSMRLGYHVDSLVKECEKLDQENKQWETKVIFLLSMERLDKLAKERKLISPGENDIIYING